MPNKNPNREKLYYLTHNIRRSQAISPYGVGAMVDFIDQTLMIADPEYWLATEIIHDERLEKVLKVDSFRMIPKYERGSSKNGMPFVRFPEWYFCPSCRNFMSIKKWEKEYLSANTEKSSMVRPQCRRCKSYPTLVPARLVVACTNGHIHDFPWSEWVHANNKKNKYSKICSNPEIKISTGSATSGLEGVLIECKCGAKATLTGAFEDNVFKNLDEGLRKAGVFDSKKYLFRCKGCMPWKNEKEDCVEFPKTIQRGGSNVYYSKVDSSLVIPPFSDLLTRKIEQSRAYNDFVRDFRREEERGRLERFLEEDFDYNIDKISGEIDILDKEKIKKIIQRKLINVSDYEENELTRNKYREDEYAALIGEIKIDKNSKDFNIELMNISEYGVKQFSKVSLVHKLKEVRALTGFTRIYPPDRSMIVEENGSSIIVSTKHEQDRWYPACEVRGEGIFIEFDSKEIERWVSDTIAEPVLQNVDRINSNYDLLMKRLNFPARRMITPKFIMLHTLAHLLIKQLCFECGYSSASLRERIYCEDGNDTGDRKMSGILIYTASGDSEGTLGGLVQQGLPNALPSILRTAVRKARWCSYDPICIESKGQGRDSLNMAACHACALISETSCEEFNSLLDRTAVVGNLKNPKAGFFSDLLVD